MKPRRRLFLILWLAGIAGVLSFLLVDLTAMINAIPPPDGGEPVELPPPALLRLASVIQPAVLTTLAVLIGMWLAPKVDLHAPAAEAWAERRPFFPELRRQIAPGIVTGILAGVAIVACWLIAKPYLTPDFIARAETFNAVLPPAVRFLYGGFTEEILLRWGVMTFFVFALWRLLGRGEERPKARWFVIGILGSALLFGLGHLPVASMLAGGLTLPLTAYVVTANSIFGIAAGFLYWRWGLESAIIAHILAHVVLLAAIAAGS
jgi:hypothetical protein